MKEFNYRKLYFLDKTTLTAIHISKCIKEANNLCFPDMIFTS